MPQPPTCSQRETEEELEAKRQEQIKRDQALVALLTQWAQGDAQDQDEQRETWELLQRVLDEDRLSVTPAVPTSDAMIVLLDTGPLGLVTNPRATAQNAARRASVRVTRASCWTVSASSGRSSPNIGPPCRPMSKHIVPRATISGASWSSALDMALGCTLPSCSSSGRQARLRSVATR